MRRQNYRRYNDWSGPHPTYASPINGRRQGSKLNGTISQFMAARSSRFSVAIALGVIIAIVYALLFGLSFAQYLFSTILFTAVSIGVSVLSRNLND